MASALTVQAGDPPSEPQDSPLPNKAGVSPPAASSGSLQQQTLMERIHKMWQALIAVQCSALTSQTTRQVAAIAAVITLLTAFLIILVPVFLLYHINGPRGGERVTAANDPFLRIVVGPPMQLVSRCQPFHVAGFNAYQLCEAAYIPPATPLANIPSVAAAGPRGPTAAHQRQLVAEGMARAAALGMNTVRTWAFTSNPRTPFQTSPGVYDEAGLEALDFVLHTASLLGLRVILCLVDNWLYLNGVDQYVDWSSMVPGSTVPVRAMGHSPREDTGEEKARHALFWSDPLCKAMYRAHAQRLTHRRNVFSGLLYMDDPTIMAWNLANEPRCVGAGCHQALQAWIEEMSLYLKSQAPRQLVTIGSEGFFGPSTPSLLKYNPQEWAANVGQDFVANNAAEGIDFATLHSWPENWSLGSTPYLPYIETFLTSHLDHAMLMAAEGGGTAVGRHPPPRLRKPVLLEEFGKRLQGSADVAALRDPVFEATYRVVERLMLRQSPEAWQGVTPRQQSAEAGQQAVQELVLKQSAGAGQKALLVSDGASMPLLGSLFWMWNEPLIGVIDEYGVLANHSTAGIIEVHARLIRSVDGSMVHPPGSWAQQGCP